MTEGILFKPNQENVEMIPPISKASDPILLC